MIVMSVCGMFKVDLNRRINHAYYSTNYFAEWIEL